MSDRSSAAHAVHRPSAPLPTLLTRTAAARPAVHLSLPLSARRSPLCSAIATGVAWSQIVNGRSMLPCPFGSPRTDRIQSSSLLLLLLLLLPLLAPARSFVRDSACSFDFSNRSADDIARAAAAAVLCCSSQSIQPSGLLLTTRACNVLCLSGPSARTPTHARAAAALDPLSCCSRACVESIHPALWLAADDPRVQRSLSLRSLLHTPSSSSLLPLLFPLSLLRSPRCAAALCCAQLASRSALATVPYGIASRLAFVRF
jgi:hypothetical protein